MEWGTVKPNLVRIIGEGCMHILRALKRAANDLRQAEAESLNKTLIWS